MKNLIYLVFISCLISSCAQSLIYSPALNLSEKPLKKEEVEFKVKVGAFPETRPYAIERKTSTAFYGSIGYGFTPNFNLTIGGFSDSKGNKGGIECLSRICLQNFKDGELIFVPRYQFVFGDFTTGSGIELPAVYLQRFNSPHFAYFGLGIAYGFENEDMFDNTVNNSPDGLGVIGHLGYGFSIDSKYDLNFELNPIYQINRYDDKQDFILAPTISFSIRL